MMHITQDLDEIDLAAVTNSHLQAMEYYSAIARILDSGDNAQITLLRDALGLPPSPDVLPWILSKPIADLDFWTRARNALEGSDILYIGNLVRKSEMELLRCPNLGRESLRNIKEVLAEHGLTLGMRFANWPPINLPPIK